MKVGISLPTAYLSGAYDIGKEEQCWFEMFGPVDDGLAVLAGLGVSGIELRDARDAPDSVLIGAATAAVGRAGMSATVHLWLPGFAKDPTLPPNMRAADEALRRFGQSGARSPSAMHSHDRNDFDTTEAAIEQTARDLVILCRLLEEAGSVLKPSLELCRFKEDAPVGTSFSELCQIAELADCPTLGFCWDMGHGLANHVSYGASVSPPKEFLERVTHTHIHDLDERGRTHGPLGTESLIASMVHQLVESDYDGIYNLELEPTRWPDTPKVRRANIEQSIMTLQHLLMGATGSPVPLDSH